MLGKDKIVKMTELADICNRLRSDNRKIVHCHGVFDLLHIGHIKYFENARRMGDALVVTVTPDRYVDKGPHHPAFNEDLRAEAVASLGYVDYVAVNEWPTAEETLRTLKPNVYVKGSEFKEVRTDATGKIQKEAQVVKEIGAKLAFSEDIVFSSSNLINRYFSTFPKEVNEYLSLFRQRYNSNDILKLLDDVSLLKVLVIGDTILDEYQYCDAIGKSSKDPVIAVKYRSHDLFAGGVLAVANHAANFVNKVDLLSVLGEQNSHEDFIRSQLRANISPDFIYQPDAPTTIKRRFIDGYSLNKLLEVYVMNSRGLPVEREEKVCVWLKNNLKNYDLVIVSDFGHGTISKKMKEALIENSNFLAVNTQANAGNRGFNTISRYKAADYVCIAEHELRLEMRNEEGEMRPMMEELAKKIECKRCVVTCGRRGALIRPEDGEFVEVPAFAEKIVDRVGAGDAFFAITSLLAACNAPDELIAFVGNVAGSLAVEIVGNKKSIDKPSVQKYITTLMK